MFRFHDPLYLLLLLIIPIVVYIKYFRKQNIFQSSMRYSSVKVFKNVKIHTSFWKKYLVLILILLSYACFVIALARPQVQSGYINIQSEGIDIVVVLDLSGSMKFIDGIPDELVQATENAFTKIYIDENGVVKNRLDIAKKILIEFVEKRKNDRIGLVVFSDYPYTESPVTISRDIIIEKIKNISFTHTKGKATAMGDAIVSGINKLMHSKNKSKILILITDGNSNKGEDPVAMSYLAKDEGIKIYCVGIGANKEVLRPDPTSDYNKRNWVIYKEVPMEDGERLDEETLKKITSITNGKYFLGSNEQELRNIYNEIDKLEKSKEEFNSIYIDYKEHFFPLVFMGLIFILLAFILDNTILRILP